MSIPASQIVTVNPRLLTPGGNDLEFNGLLLSKSALIPASQFVLPFPDPDSVGEYFGFESDEYKAAVIYFLGYNNSFNKPRAIYVALRAEDDRAPFIRGANFPTITSQTLAALKQIDAGEMTIELGGFTGTLTGLDFSSANALSDIAQTIQTAMQAQVAGGTAWTGATVTYSSLHDAYTITGGEAGAEQGIDFASGEVADALLLTQEAGAVLSPGVAGMGVAENMEAILDLTTNFVCFTTVDKASEADVLDYAAWTAGKGVNYLYVFWDDDPRLLQPNNPDTIAAKLKEANAGATAGVYNSLDYAAMILGTAASIDWNRRNGTITFAFKSQDGVAANVIKGTDAKALEAQNMNFMGDYATRNDNFVFMYPGRMFGQWTWIDTYLNAVWLNNALQVAIMNGLVNSPRVPYTSDGYALVRSWCMDPISRGLYNGIIDAGVRLSESQRAELHREAGRDIATELFTDGYVLQINDPAGAVRWRRESPECSLWYTYGGSIHKIDLASTAVV